MTRPKWTRRNDKKRTKIARIISRRRRQKDRQR